MAIQRTRHNAQRQIDLTEIKSKTTCLDLEIPLQLCYDNCGKKYEAKLGFSKKSSRKQGTFCSMSKRC
eukprot:3612227-Ditylum_brightwellii.AAC.1